MRVSGVAQVLRRLDMQAEKDVNPQKTHGPRKRCISAMITELTPIPAELRASVDCDPP